MKTILVTDKMAEDIERLRNEDGEELAYIRELVCNAFSAITDLMNYGSQITTPIQIAVNEYYRLIKDLTEDAD